jgi:hypothetical protein
MPASPAPVEEAGGEGRWPASRVGLGAGGGRHRWRRVGSGIAHRRRGPGAGGDGASRRREPSSVVAGDGQRAAHRGRDGGVWHGSKKQERDKDGSAERKERDHAT